MEEDDFLVETASWARYYERANELIQQARSAGAAASPPRELVDNPRAFVKWLEQCEKAYLTRINQD